MNKQKVDFIVAFNNQRFFDECKFYVNKLVFPQDFEVNMVGIKDAVSIAAAYNEGMRASDAKYKVYLHQDVFILNKNFINDVLRIFESDSSVGIIGVLGGTEVPDNGVLFDVQKCGKVKTDGAYGVCVLDLEAVNEDVEADVIDGMVMVTQYDFPWREDLFTDWDFYDASQSYEFRKQGFRLVVPHQEESWSMHDCGLCKLKEYDQNRKVFCKEYLKELGEEEFEKSAVYDIEMGNLYEQMKKGLIQLIEEQELQLVSEILSNINAKELLETELRVMKIVFQIYDLEMQDENRDYVMFTDHGTGWSKLYDHFTNIKFLLRRIEYNYLSDVEELLTLIQDKNISPKAISVLTEYTVFDKERVFGFLYPYFCTS